MSDKYTFDKITGVIPYIKSERSTVDGAVETANKVEPAI